MKWAFGMLCPPKPENKFLLVQLNEILTWIKVVCWETKSVGLWSTVAQAFLVLLWLQPGEGMSNAERWFDWNDVLNDVVQYIEQGITFYRNYRCFLL